MSKLTQKELKGYFSDVSAAIVCKEKQKKAFLQQLRSDVEDFLLENPDSSLKQIEDCFGTAEKISHSFMENAGTKEITQRLKLKKYILIALVAALVIYAAFVVISLIDVHTEAHGFFTEGIMMAESLLRGDLR